MFGRRDKTIPPATEASSSATRIAPKSPSEALKPSAVPPPPPRMRRPRGGLLSLLSGLLSFVLVAAGIGVFGVLMLDRKVDEPGPLGADTVVVIPKSTGISEIADLLRQRGVIDNPRLFELYAYLHSQRGSLKAGEFLFKAGTSIESAIDTLVQGKAILHSLTIPEGLTSEQIVQRIRDNDVLTGDVREVPREGSLLPNTYKFERGMTRQQIVNLMQSAEREALAKAWAGRASDLPIRTPQELVILASIVEKETGKADERPHVASVFLNRLSRRMKLQSDPTIVYGLVGGKGTLGRGIMRSEIDKASPYNTYVIEGLPPGPIANPGRAALEAVANPMKTKDLYFVADGTGGHVFSETYDQHLKNVARWRQVEQSRNAAQPGNAATEDADRAPPNAAPDNRTELNGEANLPRSASAEPVNGGPGGGRAFDAVEGTALDPLRNKTWDLTSPKTVPAFKSEESVAAAAAPAQRPATRTRRSARTAHGAD